MADVKENIKNDYLSGAMPKELAEKYDTSLNTIKSWIKRYGWSKLKNGGAPSNAEGAPPNNVQSAPPKRKRGGQPGNHNATGPPGNKHAGNVTYAIGYKVLYNNVLYKCLQQHNSQSDWAPDAAPSLWAKVLISDPEAIPEWEQPDSTNPYGKGDRVTHNGKTWESLVDSNVWEPGATGTESLWKEVA